MSLFFAVFTLYLLGADLQDLCVDVNLLSLQDMSYALGSVTR